MIAILSVVLVTFSSESVADNICIISINITVFSQAGAAVHDDVFRRVCNIFRLFLVKINVSHILPNFIFNSN
jgi:hypothetical protein